MNKFFVTTSRGWLADTATSAQQAYAACRKLRVKDGIDYKVVKPTPYRLVLGNPVALSIPPGTNIVIENGVAYSYVTQSYYDTHILENNNVWICPYTNAEGLFDATWLAEWDA